jgi:hypothetical protein
MANLDLAAPNIAILHKRRFSCAFAGRRPRFTVAEIVQCGEPFFSGISVVKNLANLAAEMYG